MRARRPGRGRRDAGARGAALPRRPGRLSRQRAGRRGMRYPAPLPRRRSLSPAARLEGVEWALAWRADGDRGFLNSYCNTVPTPAGGTHEAGLRAALAKGLRGPRRTREEPPREGHRGRGRPRRRPRPALAFHLRSAIPGSDQRTPVLARRGAARRSDGARPFRPLAGAGSGSRQCAAGVCRSTAPRSVCGGAANARSRASRRRANCAFPANSPKLLAGRRRRHRRSSSSRAIPPAGRRNRRATARPRPSSRCAAKSSTSPRRRRKKLRANKELVDLIRALGCGAGDSYREENLRLRARHRHDRRRCRRGAYRLASDHLLLPGNARPHSQRAPSPRATAALPSDPRRDPRVYARDDAHRDALRKKRIQGGSESGDGPFSRASAKCRRRSSRRRRWTRGHAPCCASRFDPESEAPTARRVEDLMGARR